MSVIKVTKSNFNQEVRESDRPVLIDFWAPWCAPCRMLSPVVDEISDEVKNVKVCKINIDEELELATAFRVATIPTLVYMKAGKVIETSIGVKPKQMILDIIK